MTLTSEERSIIRESARRFFLESKDMCIDACRQSQRAGSLKPLDYHGLWERMLKMGLGTILIPEASGGGSGDYVLMGEFLKLSGEILMQTPLLWTGMMTLDALKNTVQQKTYLQENTIIIPAFDEHLYHDPFNIKTRARKNKDNYVLNGSKFFVIDGQHADTFLISAKINDNDKDVDFGLFLVPKDLCEITPTLDTLDARGAVHIVCKDVSLPQEAFIGGNSCYHRILTCGYVGLSCEMLGLAQALFDRTINYLKERKQFGHPIGSFQALQHRASMLFESLSIARCVVAETLETLQSGDIKRAQCLSHVCKKRCNDLVRLVSKESIQMHGGIGMTAECDVGLYFKRGRVQENLLGTSDFHKERYLHYQKIL